ncbi:MAG: PorT family protein [Fibrobacteraceae bacterium]|nr:PorT family protein [Fibrobacteraceae bacterium]MCF0217006.1 PorT family protein [Fibrobacteraceae bacterium]
MKKVVLALMVLLFAQASFAMQKGVRLGEGLGFFSGDDKGGVIDEIGSNSAVTFEMGFPINDLIVIHPAVGMGFDIYTYEYDDDDDSSVSLLFLRIDMPVMVQFRVVKGLFFDAGIDLSMNVLSGLLYSYDDDSKFEDDNVDDSTFELGLIFGVGYRLSFGLGFDIRYIMGLTNELDEASKNDYSQHKIQFGISFVR